MGGKAVLAPLIQFGVAAIFIELSTDEIFDCKERLLLCNFLMALAVISSMGTIKANLEQPLRVNKDFNPVILFIKSQGYTQGIASFWHSNVVTELTNGDVEMWTKTSEYDDMDRWLTKSAHDGIPEGNYFILCAKEDGEDKNIGNYNQINNVSGKKVYEDANYVIYEYN